MKKARISSTEAVPEDLDIPKEVRLQDDEVSVGSLMEGDVSEEEQDTEPPGTRLFCPYLFSKMFLKVFWVLKLDGDSAESEASTSSATTSKKWGAPAVFPSNQDELRGLLVPDYFESLVSKELEHPYRDRICLKPVFKFYNLEPDFMQRLKSP